MQAALIAIWASIALGAAIGIWQRFTPEATGPVRSFALVAAGSVVTLSLLPHALLSKGALGLAVAALGFYAIPALDWLLRRGMARMPGSSPRLTVTYIGLLIHRIADGVALSVDGHGFDVLFALGAHEVPIVALVVAMSASEGLPKAFGRAALLGLASTLGCWLVRALPGPLWHDWHGWVDALSAGILGHVIAHELSAERVHGARRRALDLAGALLGLVLVCVPAAEAESELPLQQLLLARLLQAATPVALGFAVTASLRAWTRPHNPWLFARSVHPFAAGEARPDTIALSIGSLGWHWALARSIGAVLLVGLIALFPRTRAILRSRHDPSPVAPEASAAAWSENPSAPARFWLALDGAIWSTAGPLMLGLLLATYAEAFFPALRPQPPISRAIGSAALVSLCVLGVAWTARYSAAAATPIAAVLIGKGMPPALALGALWLGAATNAHVIARLRARGSSLLRWCSIGALSSAVLGLAVLPASLVVSPLAWVPDWLNWLSLAGLSALLGRQIWSVGVRHWLGSSLSIAAVELEGQPGHLH